MNNIKKTIKLFLISSFIYIFSLFSFLHKPTHAQTPTPPPPDIGVICTWIGGTTGCIVDATLSSPECRGDEEQSFCQEFTSDTQCEGAGGYCNECDAPLECFDTTCPSDYTPISSLKCSNVDKVCCSSSAVPTPTPGCWKCDFVFGSSDDCHPEPLNSSGLCDYYPSQSTCDSNCPPTTSTTFACNPTGDLAEICIASPSGPYSSFSACQTACFSSTASPTPTPPGGTIIPTLAPITPPPIGTTMAAFYAKWVRFGLSLGGATAFLLIIYSGFLITTSTGDPKRIQAGKELLNAALSGLALLIFSVYLLDIIGVKIFKLPGL